MLEKPDLPDELIVHQVKDQYDLQIARLKFLPLGADVNTAVYRLEAFNGQAFFLKLRKGAFDEASVTLPQFLKAQGIPSIIAPIETRQQRSWAAFGEYKLVLYPYIEGQDGYQVELTEQEWAQFGAALKSIHSVSVPTGLARLIPRERYSPHWREEVRRFQAMAVSQRFEEPIACKMAAFIQDHQAEIDHLVERAGQLANELQTRDLDEVLCHADIHAGNLLIASGGKLYIVDWDNPIFAPKERDLMFIGGGISSRWRSRREEALFYRGYGPATVDQAALAYYRYERVIEDIAAFGEQILLSDAGGQDREQGYIYFTSSFLPDHEIEIARKTQA